MGDIQWTTEKRRLCDLVAWEHNPRQIKKAEAERLIDSLEQFGQIQTIAVGPDNQIYDGHQRKLVWAASQKFGADYAVDVRVSSRALTERERQQLVVYLHKGTVGEWDWDMLANEFELDDLKDWGFTDFDFQLAGWDVDEEPPPDPGPQIDRAVELQEKWGTALGQVWKLDDHRLVCGDCTDKAVVDAAMRGEWANAIVTDPPYGLSDTKDFETGTHWVPVYDDSLTFDLSLLVFPDDFVIFGGQYYDQLPVPRNKIGWFVWDKRPDLEGEKRERADRRFGQHFELAVTNIGDLRGKMYRQRWGGYYGSQEIYHQTMKPPELFEWCIKSTGGDVLDYFVGSGTAIIACERLGRRCRAIEIEPKYIAVTLQRWHDMTGRDPVLVSE